MASLVAASEKIGVRTSSKTRIKNSSLADFNSRAKEGGMFGVNTSAAVNNQVMTEAVCYAAQMDAADGALVSSKTSLDSQPWSTEVIILNARQKIMQQLLSSSSFRRIDFGDSDATGFGLGAHLKIAAWSLNLDQRVEAKMREDEEVTIAAEGEDHLISSKDG